MKVVIPVQILFVKCFGRGNKKEASYFINQFSIHSFIRPSVHSAKVWPQYVLPLYLAAIFVLGRHFVFCGNFVFSYHYVFGGHFYLKVILYFATILFVAQCNSS
jgi:hypothetical protein